MNSELPSIEVLGAYDRLLNLLTTVMEIGKSQDHPTLEAFESDVEIVAEFLDQD
jgi:hypothetical protein